MAPASNRSASLSEVLPLPRCPTRATLRISSGDWWAICLLSSGTSEPNARGKRAGSSAGLERCGRGGRGQLVDGAPTGAARRLLSARQDPPRPPVSIRCARSREATSLVVRAEALREQL